MYLRTGQNALLLLFLLLIDDVKQAKGFLIHQKSSNCSPTLKRRSITPKDYYNELQSSLQQPKLPAIFSDSLRDSKPPKRRFFLWATAILIPLLLVPLRANASTITEPVVVATEAAAAAAAAAATASAATASASLAALANPPVSAAMEMKLSFRLLWAALIGACLGKERSFSKHSAGVRTMALVSMGASAFTVCSAYGFVQFAELGMKCDPSRMAANVASGVGFVGAGVITTSAANHQNVVHGLTTAATIWLSAAVGVACGVGLTRVATTAAIATIFILRLGRQKPKHRTPPSLVVTKTRPLAESLSRYEDRVEDDDEDDHFAEIHDTSVWDEHNHEDPQEDSVQHIPHPPLEKSKAEEEFLIAAETKFDLEEDDGMGEVFRAAWRNSTHQDQHTETIEQFAPAKREFSDAASRRRP